MRKKNEVQPINSIFAAEVQLSFFSLDQESIRAFFTCPLMIQVTKALEKESNANSHKVPLRPLLIYDKYMT